MPIFSLKPLGRSSGLRLLRAVWRSEAGNALYATMLLIPVGMGIVGAGVDGLYWYQAREALHKSAYDAARSAYAAYQDGTEMEDAARGTLKSNSDRYGEILSLSVSVATDADRKAADLAVSTRLLLPITSKLLGFAMTLETRAASDEDTTASKMAGVVPDPDQEAQAEDLAEEDTSGGGSGESGLGSSAIVNDNGGGSSSPAPRPIVTESVDRIDPSSVAKNTGPSPVVAP